MKLGYTLVRLPPQDKAVYFVIPRVHPEAEVSEFRVDENDCPTNFLRNIKCIIVDGDTDPHGLFEHVRDLGELPFTQQAHGDDDWRMAVPEAFAEN